MRREVRGNIGDSNLFTGLDGADRGQDEGERILIPVPFGIGSAAVWVVQSGNLINMNGLVGRTCDYTCWSAKTPHDVYSVLRTLLLAPAAGLRERSCA